jgi:iron complex transport system substrate-binding protein
MKKIVVISIVLILCLSCIGCNKSNNNTKDTVQGVFPVTIQDSMGREVTIEKEPEKIVSLAPAVTEILYRLNLGDKIVGVTDYCDYPEDALQKPKVGGFKNPNMEVVIDLEPDLVLTSAGIQEDLLHQLDNVGIVCVSLSADNIEEVLENIELAGKVTGKSERASNVVADLQQRIVNLDEKINQAATKPVVFFEIWDDPLMSAGPGSFINDLIVRCGAINPAGDAKDEYPQFNIEVLLEKNPDIYIINSHARVLPDNIKKRDGYESLKAIQNNKVYIINDDLVSRSGPRIVDGFEEMAKIIHPEVF